jgi:hypothetical protein
VETQPLELFKQCLEVGNTQLLTRFQGQIYLQLNGLAMGVADSPDLANLYGAYFEEKARVLDSDNIYYYGRYIDDCLAVVYAESEEQAVNILKDKIKFDGCVIEWDASGSHAPFLDMMLYKDADNTLQHMPYRKTGNHQERIPWISAHPYDVKRGTYLGEMSRLAVLSSKLEHYYSALRDLTRLYIHRGYPEVEVFKWLRANISKRWSSRLDANPKSSLEGVDLLVLKTQYNLAWNYFNASQLGDTIFGYWREWLERARAGQFNSEFPAPSDESYPGETLRLFDLGETSTLLNPESRIIISRKRTRNFMDLTNLWKRVVLENLEEQTLDDILKKAGESTAQKRPLFTSDDINLHVVGRRQWPRVDPLEEGELMPEHHRGSSPEPGIQAWRNASFGSWGPGGFH